MALNTNTTDTGGLSIATAVFYDKLLLDRLMKKLRFVEQGSKRTLPAGQGKSISVTRSSNLTAVTSALTDGTIPEGVAYQTTSTTITPLQYGNYVAYSDRLALEALSDVGKDLMDIIGYNAGHSLDTVCRNALHSNVTNQYAGGANGEATVASVFNASEIRKAVKTLRTNDAMEYSDDTFHAVIHPASAADVQADTAVGGWMDLNKYVSEGRNDALKGEIGKILNTRFAVSSNVGTGTGANAATTYRNFIFADKGFYTVDVANTGVQRITHQPGTSGTADPLNQIGTVGWKAYFVVGAIDSNRIVEVYATSAY